MVVISTKKSRLLKNNKYKIEKHKITKAQLYLTDSLETILLNISHIAYPYNPIWQNVNNIMVMMAIISNLPISKNLYDKTMMSLIALVCKKPVNWNIEKK